MISDFTFKQNPILHQPHLTYNGKPKYMTYLLEFLNESSMIQKMVYYVFVKDTFIPQPNICRRPSIILKELYVFVYEKEHPISCVHSQYV